MEIQKNLAGDSCELLVSGRIDGEGANRLETEILAILFHKNTTDQQPPKTLFVNLTLVRCVALLPLTAHGTPDYLFTSGKANCYNPAGLLCIYLLGLYACLQVCDPGSVVPVARCSENFATALRDWLY